MSATSIVYFKAFLNTPPLWKDQQFGLQQFDFPDLDLKNFVPKYYPDNIRLGHQMEHVFHQLLGHSKRYTVLVRNLPIRKNKRDIGEIDFVVLDKLLQIQLHIELSYKFYLIDLSISNPLHQLIGPNRGDVFFAKLEKVKNKQFPLSQTDAGIKALKTHHINSNTLNNQACFKAQLFVPYTHSNISLHPINQDCICGYWLSSKLLKEPYFKATSFYIPKRQEWVLLPEINRKWISYNEAILEINAYLLQKKSPMVWLLKPDGTMEKCFVVWWSNQETSTP